MTSALRLANTCIALLVLLAPLCARASSDACNEAYVQTQRLQRTGQLLRAREQALACARDECSVTVRRGCSSWLEDIADAMPSVVVEARDAAGNELLDVRVFSGERLVAESLDGKALPLDPGAHELRFEHRGEVELLRVVALEGQAYRHVSVRFGARPSADGTAASSLSSQQVSFMPQTNALHTALSLPAASLEPRPRAPAPLSLATPVAAASALPPPEGSKQIPLSTHVFGGVGLASMTAFGLLATSAYADEKALRQSCGKTCDPGAVDSVHDRYLMADVALAFGISSLIAAGALWLFLPDAPPPELRGSRMTYQSRF